MSKKASAQNMFRKYQRVEKLKKKTLLEEKVII